MKQTKKRIIYDDTCPMCIAVVSGVDDSSKSNSFALEGATVAKLPKGVTPAQVQKEIHVIDESGVVHRNVDAMLQIAQEYPRLRFVVRIARLPIVYQFLQLIYTVVAANRHFIFGPAARLYWLKNVVIIGLMAGILLSLPLWTGSSSFPSVPMLSFLPVLPNLVAVLFCILLFVLLGGALVVPKPRLWVLGSVGVVGIMVLFDQMRLQPWVYQYMWMLVVLGLYSWRITQKNNRYVVLQTLRIIIASIYFFSGLQKVNPDFMATVFPWLVEPLTALLPSAKPAIESLGAIIPFMELAIGIALFVPKLRKTAVISATLMAGGILLLIGPLGHGWNSVVWPWNIVMPVSTALLFWHNKSNTFKDALGVRGFLLHKLIIIVFLFLPLLSFYGRWDSYLSWTLYSGNTAKAAIYLDPLTAKSLPGSVQRYIELTPSGLRLSMLDWAIGESHVPPYPETRVFKAVAASVCRDTDDDRGIELIVTNRSTQLRQAQQIYHCSDL